MLQSATKKPFDPQNHQAKPDFPIYNPPERPKSIYYKGAEFYYNSATGEN
jgi:hypothetical protein